MQDINEKIREHAYHLWVADGRREGEGHAHWLQAEREVLAGFAATSKPAKAPAEPKPKAAAKAKGKWKAA